VVGGPAREVVETVTPPLRETTEAVTAPVQEVTEAAPPAREVTEAATAPVEGIVKEVTPPVKAAAESVAQSPAVPSLKSPQSPASQVAGAVRGAVSSSGARSTSSKTEGVNRTTKSASEDVSGAVQSTPNGARRSETDAAVSSGAPEETTGGGSGSPSSSDRTTAPRGAVITPSPTKDGATAAPLPKWVSYVWPAVALARPFLANLLDTSESALRLLVFGASNGSGADQGVAGVHASGGRPGLQNPSLPPSPSSPLSKISTAVGQFPYNISGAALGYIAIVAIMLIGLFVAVRWEIAHGRREGRG
jgi:hypothetical protein